jgi:hypothetical protein
VDHGWCTSVYASDPNGTMVEWCITTAEFTEEDRAAALAAVTGDIPLNEAWTLERAESWWHLNEAETAAK